MLFTTNGNSTARPKTNGATNGAGEVTSMGHGTRVIYGVSLAHSELDKRQLAVVGANVLDGLAWYVPTQQQMANCLDISVPYIQLAKSLSWTKRSAILAGQDPVSFADLLLLRRLSATTNISAAVSDRALVAMASSIGSAERWLAAGTAAGLR
jgi:hypothetical protein